MTFKRRHFLMFLGMSAGTAAAASWTQNQQKFAMPFATEASVAASPGNVLSFQPVKSVMPLNVSGMAASKQIESYSSFEVVDDLVLPEGFTYDMIATWGDRVGNSRFGYNNDYLSFIETAPNEGLLTVNFEYISSIPWSQTYQQVIGKALPFEELETALKAVQNGELKTFTLNESDRLKQVVREIAKEALIDVGMGVISVRRNPDGKWVRTYAAADRRVTGISGLEDGNYLKSTGPATTIFRKSGQGYSDNLGDKIIGTLNNCAGGTSPWGTVFSAEENFQNYVPEPVYADGSSFHPDQKGFYKDVEEIGGLGNVFGFQGNKYGWMVEIDPANPKDYGTKHTWLGRYRHEAVAIRAEAEKPLAIYSGCDRRSGHLYKFVSQAKVRNPQDKNNSKLLNEGMLYAAKFNLDGTGRWIPLKADTPINPDLPSVHAGGLINLPKRPDGGVWKVTKDEEITAFKQQFSTLGDLYSGNAIEQQGAILIDAHFAANAAGATCTARPEDTELRPDGSLYIAYTSGSPSSSDGGPDLRIFKGPDGKDYEYGWIMRVVEDDNQLGAMTFRWTLFATGGEPAEGGLGFANPDNLTFDRNGDLWMVTDMSTDKHNRPVPKGRVDKAGKPLSQSNLRGLFANNSIWFLPTAGPNAGEAYLFGYAPMEVEVCGPFWTPDQQTLFAAMQHPGEVNGVRKDMAFEMREFALQTTDGQEFMQTRKVPIGSNWPGKRPNDPPKPSVVAIRRINHQPVT